MLPIRDMHLQASVLVGFVLAAAGCSREVDSSAVGFVFEPPKSMKFVRDSAGSPAVAKFENGLEIRSVKGTLRLLDDPTFLPIRHVGTFDELGRTLYEARTDAKLSLPRTIVSEKMGTITAGNFVRYELEDEKDGALLYVVQGNGRYLTVSLIAPRTEFDGRVNQLERAMSTLRFR